MTVDDNRLEDALEVYQHEFTIKREGGASVRDAKTAAKIAVYLFYPELKQLSRSSGTSLSSELPKDQQKKVRSFWAKVGAFVRRDNFQRAGSSPQKTIQLENSGASGDCVVLFGSGRVNVRQTMTNIFMKYIRRNGTGFKWEFDANPLIEAWGTSRTSIRNAFSEKEAPLIVQGYEFEVNQNDNGYLKTTVICTKMPPEPAQPPLMSPMMEQINALQSLIDELRKKAEQ